MKMTHPSRAEKALNFFINKKAKVLGMNSTEVLTHFMMISDTLDGKFMTEDYMIRNNMMESDIFQTRDSLAVHRVMGIDFASASDRTVAVVMDVYESNKNEDDYRYEVREVIVLNPNMEKLSQNEIARDISSFCLSYQVDMILCDVTGTQQPYASAVVKALELKGVNTLVCGYNFAGSNKAKVNMMSYLESNLVGQQTKLPKKKYHSTHVGCKILHKELLVLKKEKDKTKSQNTQYYAKYPDHDDSVMALALANYCIVWIKNLMFKGKMIELENKRYVPRLNKFQLLSEIPEEKMYDSYIDVYF